MAFLNKPFKVRRGDERVVEIDVNDLDGTASSLEGALIRWTYALSAGGVSIKTKTEADLTVLGSKIRNTMGREETAALSAYQTYWLQCRITFPGGADGFRETVATGSFTVEPTQ